jgi:hypothetical protein
MRAKQVVRSILFLGAILTAVSLYLFLYFYPAVKTMNRIRRETADVQMKIGNMRKTLSVIRLPDDKEKERVVLQERRLQSELKQMDAAPTPDSRRNKTEAVLKQLALRTGIGTLGITRLTPSDRLAGISIRSFAVPGLSARSLSLCFSTRLDTASAFLASIPAACANLIVEHLEIRESNPEPDFHVIVKEAFLGPPEVPANGNEAEIDIDSTLPLDRVTEIPDEETVAPDLSGGWTRMRFVAPSPGPAVEKANHEIH